MFNAVHSLDGGVHYTKMCLQGVNVETAVPNISQATPFPVASVLRCIIHVCCNSIRRNEVSHVRWSHKVTYPEDEVE